MLGASGGDNVTVYDAAYVALAETTGAMFDAADWFGLSDREAVAAFEFDLTTAAPSGPGWREQPGIRCDVELLH